MVGRSNVLVELNRQANLGIYPGKFLTAYRPLVIRERRLGDGHAGYPETLELEERTSHDLATVSDARVGLGNLAYVSTNKLRVVTETNPLAAVLPRDRVALPELGKQRLELVVRERESVLDPSETVAHETHDQEPA